MSTQVMDEAQSSALRVPNNLGRRSGAVAFVGREQDLERLRERLQHTGQLAITALKGMGGIGKTELALQYALESLNQGTYPGGVAWFGVRGLDVGTQIVEFAQGYLGLMVPDGLTLEGQVAYCWQRWPTPAETALDQVLVVFDDVTDYGMIRPYLPPPHPRFRVLMTTREYLGASLQTLELDVLDEASALNLLRSLTDRERIDSQLETAKALCKWVGYLPLALELVGRYLSRRPGLSLVEMQQQLESKRLAARALVKPEGDMTAQLGVAAAFELSMADLSEETQRLAYVLSLFASAALPWVLVEQCWPEVDREDLEDWRVNLEGSSLLQSGDEVYQVHPLIREFLQVRFGEATWAEETKRGYCKAMVQVAQQIPQSPTQAQILGVAIAVPHLAEAATRWQHWLGDDDLIWPFVGLACFFAGQGTYEQSIFWHRNALQVSQERFGNKHPYIAGSLNNLGAMYRLQGRYSEAEPLCQQALNLSRDLLGEEHLDVAISLGNLAELYRFQGRYSEAEPLYQQALALDQKLLGNEHPAVANDLNNLALLYKLQGRYSEAEPLYEQALALRLQLLSEHPAVATSLNNLASLYESQKRYSEAESLYKQALTMRKQLLGDKHLDVAVSLNNLALLYRFQERYDEAEKLFQEALVIRQKLLSNEHPDVAQSLNNLALLYESQARYRESEKLHRQALELRQQLLGENHPDVATSLNNLAELYRLQDRYSEAEILYIQAVQIFHKYLGSAHPNTKVVLNNFVNFLNQVTQKNKAVQLSAHPLTQALLQQIQSS